MKIGLIGAGRLGICLALLIERSGYNVLVSDIRPDYVAALRTDNYGGTRCPMSLSDKHKTLRHVGQPTCHQRMRLYYLPCCNSFS